MDIQQDCLKQIQIGYEVWARKEHINDTTNSEILINSLKVLLLHLKFDKVKPSWDNPKCWTFMIHKRDYQLYFDVYFSRDSRKFHQQVVRGDNGAPRVIFQREVEVSYSISKNGERVTYGQGSMETCFNEIFQTKIFV